MNALVNHAGFGQLPAAFAGVAQQPGMNDEFGGGIVVGFPVLSIKGKTWRVKQRGEETLLRQSNGDPMFSLELVLVRATANLTKVYYPGGYVEGSTEKPECWSSDGLRPDAAVEKKQCASCASCPMNQFGSKVTDAGKQAKACSDSKRVAVVPAGNMEEFGGPLLLRIPAATLGEFKSYAERMSRNGFPIPAIVTRVAFDASEAFPKLTFREVRPLSDEEALKIQELRNSAAVARILAEASELPADTPAAPPAGVNFEQAAPSTSTQATAGIQTPPQAAQAAPQAAAAIEEARRQVEAQNAAKAQAEAEAKARIEAETKAKVEAEMRARIEAEVRARMAAEASAAAGVGAASTIVDAEIVSETVTQPVTQAAQTAVQPSEPTQAQEAPADFDSMLDGLLAG